MLKDFRDFILRGNVVDLAVAVAVGAAFNMVVNKLVADLITPLITAIFGKPNFAGLTFTIHHSTFPYGDFINVVVSFVLMATVIFFLVVQPINKLNELFKNSQKPADPTSRKCPECLSEIPLAAKRCMYCTSKVEPAQNATV